MLVSGLYYGWLGIYKSSCTLIRGPFILHFLSLVMMLLYTFVRLLRALSNSWMAATMYSNAKSCSKHGSPTFLCYRLSQLPALDKLDMSGNQLSSDSSLNEKLSAMTSLKALNLARCGLTVIPEG